MNRHLVILIVLNFIDLGVDLIEFTFACYLSNSNELPHSVSPNGSNVFNDVQLWITAEAFEFPPRHA